jgi:hypothetical protein
MLGAGLYYVQYSRWDLKILGDMTRSCRTLVQSPPKQYTQSSIRFLICTTICYQLHSLYLCVACGSKHYLSPSRETMWKSLLSRVITQWGGFLWTIGFWDVMECSPVDVRWYFDVNRVLRNVSRFLLDYKAKSRHYEYVKPARFSFSSR